MLRIRQYALVAVCYVTAAFPQYYGGGGGAVTGPELLKPLGTAGAYTVTNQAAQGFALVDSTLVYHHAAVPGQASDLAATGGYIATVHPKASYRLTYTLSNWFPGTSCWLFGAAEAMTVPLNLSAPFPPAGQLKTVIFTSAANPSTFAVSCTELGSPTGQFTLSGLSLKEVSFPIPTKPGDIGALGLDLHGSLPIRTTLLPEYNLGTCTTAATIDPANGNRQKITLTNAQTCALTFTQPTGSTASVQLTVIQSSAGGFNGAISGALWPGGTVPTITATSGAQDVITCFLNGTNAKCVATQDFR